MIGRVTRAAYYLPGGSPSDAGRGEHVAEVRSVSAATVFSIGCVGITAFSRYRNGSVSRTVIDTYRQTGQRINDLVQAINSKHAAGGWQPIVSMNRQLSYVTLNALRRLARFCLVSSLHDGMNLVAKEYVAARSDGDGVLVLSRFTGAAIEMLDALLVNPFDTDEFAARIKEAIEMPEAERRRRMKNLRATVAVNNIYRWGADMVDRLISIAEA